jgi:hypothetical protein
VSNPAAEDPRPDEVLQEEPSARTIPPVPVVVEGPIRVQQLPSPVWAMISYAGVTTSAIQIIGGELRRRKATILGSAAIRVGQSSAQADAQAAPWPANIPLEMTHDGEVWARADTGTVNIMVLVEYWTE